MKKTFKKHLSAILALIMTVTLLQIPSYADSLKDVKGHWAEKAILSLTNKSIISGYKDGTFKPDKKITRAEYVALVNRLYSLKNKANINFSDVKEDLWAYEEISIAVGEGYVTGYPDGTFRPNNPITRAEAASMLARVDKTGTKAMLSFKDEIPSWAEDAISLIVGKGYMKGYPDETFGATKDITRAEVAAMLYKVQESQQIRPGTEMPSQSLDDLIKKDDKKKDDKKDNKTSGGGSSSSGGGGSSSGGSSSGGSSSGGTVNPTPPSSKDEVTATAEYNDFIMTVARYKITLKNATKDKVSSVTLHRNASSKGENVSFQDINSYNERNELYVIVNNINEKPIEKGGYFTIKFNSGKKDVKAPIIVKEVKATAKAKKDGTILTEIRYEITLDNAKKGDVSEVILKRTPSSGEEKLKIQNITDYTEEDKIYVIVKDIYSNPIKDGGCFIIKFFDKNIKCDPITEFDKVAIPQNEKVEVYKMKNALIPTTYKVIMTTKTNKDVESVKGYRKDGTEIGNDFRWDKEYYQREKPDGKEFLVVNVDEAKETDYIVITFKNGLKTDPEKIILDEEK